MYKNIFVGDPLPVLRHTPRTNGGKWRRSAPCYRSREKAFPERVNRAQKTTIFARKDLEGNLDQLR